MPSIKIVLTLLALILPICRAAAAEASTPSYTIVDLGTLGGKNCTAFALNNHSQIVGGSQTASGITHAFIWDHGKMEDLGVLPGDKTSVAYALNDKGQAVGSSDKPGTQPVLWDNRVIKKLPVGVGSIAFGIDEAGNVTGVVINYAAASCGVFNVGAGLSCPALAQKSSIWPASREAKLMGCWYKRLYSSSQPCCWT